MLSKLASVQRNAHKCCVTTQDEMDDFIKSIDHQPNLDVAPNAPMKPHQQQGQKGYGPGGEKFDSWWEFAFFLFHKNQGDNIQRNQTEWLPYFDDTGKKRKFYPDFIVNGIFYEVKGFLRPADTCKLNQCASVQFVFGDQIKPMIEWLNKNEKGWRNSYTPR